MMQSQESLKATGTDVESGSHTVEYTEAQDQECAEFQALMAERIGRGENLQDLPHLQTCERCSALVRDLEAIVTAVKDIFPVEEEPRDELWEELSKKLKTEPGDA